jgi:hypothetical protein
VGIVEQNGIKAASHAAGLDILQKPQTSNHGETELSLFIFGVSVTPWFIRDK